MTELTVELATSVSDSSPGDDAGLLLQRPGFCAAVATPWSAQTLIVKRGDEVVARCGFLERRRRGMAEWLSPLFASFGGVWCPEAQSEPDPVKRERAWREVLQVIAGGVPARVDLAEIIFAPGDVDARALAWKGWELRPHYNYVSRWNTDGGWQDALNSSVKRQWRKAKEGGLVAQSLPAGNTDELRTLWRKMAGRQGLNPAMAEHLKGLGTWLEEGGAGFQMRVAKEDSEAAQAMALIGFDTNRVYYLAGASDPATLGTGAPTLLHAAVFEEIERRGLARCYDWVGANTPGVAQFKRGFGPELEMLIAARRRSWKRQLADGARGWLRGR